MRLLLYNIRYCAGTGHKFHLPVPFGGYLRKTTRTLSRVIEFIREARPDIVGLVEIDAGSFRSERMNQVEEIAEALGHFHSFQSKYALTSLLGRIPLLNKQVNAFLTSDRIMDEKFHYFQNGIKRLVIELELEKLNIFLVHLSLKFKHRAYQLNDLYALVNSARKPVIVAGDFNAFRGKRELNLFMKALGLSNANAGDLPTYPSRRPRRQLDFILHSPEIRVKHFEVPRVVLSDHLPLICDFEVGP